MKYNWMNGLDLRHTLGRIYLTFISYVRCLQMRLHTDDTEVVWYAKNTYDLKAIMYPLICTHHRLHSNDGDKIPAFTLYMHKISDNIRRSNQPRYTTTINMTKKAKINTSDLIMMIRRFTNISFRWPKFKWANWTHTTDGAHLPHDNNHIHV